MTIGLDLFTNVLKNFMDRLDPAVAVAASNLVIEEGRARLTIR
jgi:hypothetical protein